MFKVIAPNITLSTFTRDKHALLNFKNDLNLFQSHRLLNLPNVFFFPNGTSAMSREL